MKACNLVFPHQLCHPFALDTSLPTFIVEEYLFFSQYDFHVQKLIFHRATSKSYEDFLTHQGIDVHYIEASSADSDLRNWKTHNPLESFDEIFTIDLVDHYLEKRLRLATSEQTLNILDSPLFLLRKEELENHFPPQRKKYHHARFYQNQRIEKNILIDANGGPVGGRWSYDDQNRKKYPRGQTPPPRSFPSHNSYVKEAIEYVDKNFPMALGSATQHQFYPTTRQEALNWLEDFLDHHLDVFGPFEDAMVRGENWLHHSVLSPLVNCGLLSVSEVLASAEERHTKSELPLPSLEGFTRQLMGWREYIRGIYEVRGVEQRTANFWNFTREMPKSFYEGTTGILPVDDVIKRVLNTGYSHHIERLMVLGSFMLLCEIKTDAVYQWFMEFYIDAYDWVMVPNVYGMSQYADGGLLANKPYISGSNYILKMSNFPKGEWTEIWDALFWRFMTVHDHVFSEQPRWSMLLSTWNKKSPEQREHLLSTAEDFLQSLD